MHPADHRLRAGPAGDRADLRAGPVGQPGGEVGVGDGECGITITPMPFGCFGRACCQAFYRDPEIR